MHINRDWGGNCQAILKRTFRDIWTNLFKGEREFDTSHIPQRILLINPAHIGDVVISTSLLGVLRSAYPSVQIGFVTGSWSQPVIDGHQQIAFQHCIDHWRMNRSDISLLKKAYRYWTTRRRALAEIKKLQYDIAISLHAGFPDLLDLSWLAKIPVRIAFDRVFCAPLATQLARYPDNNLFVHQGECQAELLRKLRIEQKHFSNRVSQLAESTDRDLEEVNALLAPRQLGIGRFSVIHMGSGAKFKELPLTFWREVAETLVQDTSIVFTGRGERESNNIAKVMAGLPNCVNAADRLSWRGFVCTLRFAQKLYGVDSLAGHVAAAVGTESVTVHHGAAGPARWRPEGSKATVWTNAVDCSPCNRINGCSSMRCLSEIKPTHVLQRFVAIPSNSPGATRSNTQ